MVSSYLPVGSIEPPPVITTTAAILAGGAWGCWVPQSRDGDISRGDEAADAHGVSLDSVFETKIAAGVLVASRGGHNFLLRKKTVVRIIGKVRKAESFSTRLTKA